MSRLSLLTLAMLAAAAACSAVAQPSASASTLAGASAAIPTVSSVAASPLAGESFAPPAAEHISGAPISCDIRTRRTTNGVLIEAHAFATDDVSGAYDLVITKSGGGGSADISQGGDVDLRAGDAATLGANEISLERGARVRAVLTIGNESGELCRRTLRL